MPYYLIQLGNGYTYQTFAGSPEEALAKARSRAPAGVSVGGTDLAAAQVISQGANVPFDGYRDEMGAVPGIGQPGGGQPGAGVGPGGTGPAVPPPPIIDPPRPPPPLIPPQQPPQPPPGGGGGTGGTAPPPGGGFIGPPPSLDTAEAEPRAAFLRGLGSRGDPNTIGGRVARSRFDDFLNAFAFGNILNRQGGVGGTAFSNFGELPNVNLDDFTKFSHGQNIGSVRQLAADSLRQLFSSPTDGDALSVFARQQFMSPTEGQAGALGGLLRTGLESRVSPLALRLLNLPSGADLRDRFVAEGSGDFLDFVRRNFPTAVLGI